ncbi:MAG: replicative DNA helicase [Ruminiclostridium sp.]|nr:replicative DNA helicase [Ruminiclostridium sp.]
MAELEIIESNLPFNVDAEQIVLGSVIVEPELLTKISDVLTPDHFHIKMHSGIYGVIQKLFVGGGDINIVTVTEHCVRQGVFESQDAARTYLFKLSEMSVEKASIESYAEVLDEKYLMRQLIVASRDIFDKASSGTEEPSSMLDYAEKRIYDIRNDKEIKGLLHIGPTLRDTLRSLAYLAEHPEEASKKGMSSGFPSLDKFIFGLNPSDFILIAARPGMGKTSFAMNIAVNAARMHPEKKVAVFSLEMSREQLVARMLSSEGRIPSDALKTGRIEPSQWRNLNEAAEMLNMIEVYVDDTANITIGEMKAKLRRMNDLGLVVIDYLQLMSTGRRDGNRVNEVSEITRNLKILAKELNVPVITLSQLSRGPESRENKRPMLSDLRESGSIEQDADIVLFLYRDAYYTKSEENQESCECIIAKNRHGETATVNLRWDGQFTRFSDVEQRYGE